jgi:hypothetical protein
MTVTKCNTVTTVTVVTTVTPKKDEPQIHIRTI